MQRVQNILSIYHRASRLEVDAGLRWYFTAHEEAERIGLPLRPYTLKQSTTFTGAALIAALSPGLRWERNVEAAERVISGEGLEGLGVRWYDGVRKGQRILAGERAEDVLKGNKVLAFWDNIRNPVDSQAVTIDGHAYAIWSAERITLDDIPPISDKLYLRIQADYVEAANVVGIRPHQLQAITWTAWRRLSGISSAHYLPLFEEVA